MANVARSINLSTRILLVVLALFVAGIWSLAARVAAVLQTDLENMVSAQLSATVGYVAADIDAKLQLRIGLLDDIAASIAPDILADPAKLQRLLEQRRVSTALFPNGISVTNTEGIAIAEYPRSEGRLGGSIRDRDFFQEIMAGAKLAIGKPVMGRFAKRALVGISVPLHDASGSVVGVLTGPVFPSDPNLFGLLEETTIGNSSYFLVIAPKDGVIVSATDKSRILQPLSAKGVNPLFDRRMQGFEGVGRTINSRGVDVLSASRNIKTSGWIVIAGIPTGEAFAPIASIKQQIYLTAFVLSLLVLAVLYFVLQRQLAPLKQATTAMRRMTEGAATFAPLPAEGEDEIGQLVQSFNQLVAERGQFEDTLRHREQHMRALFDAMPIAIGHADNAERMTFANRRYRSIYGSNPDPTGRTVREVTGEKIYAFVEPYIKRALAGEEIQFERVSAGDDGLIVARSTRYVPDRNAAGQVVGFFALIEDISKRKQAEAALQRLNTELEQRVAERTQALEQANREMQSFSYSVSHDLRAPLRAIGGFSKIVLAGSAGKLDEETLSHLERIAAGADRMGQLIDDLLDLSRVSRTELRRQTVNLSQLAGEVARNLAQVQPERRVEVMVVPDMMVDGDLGLVHIMLENLIGNAWKFTSLTDNAKIEVGRYERDGETIHFVRDNGAGFDMRYAGKLFGAFQRMHSQREFEGTGIGLSIVQRIVVKHGGRVWAEAKPGDGATLYFILAQGTRAV